MKIEYVNYVCDICGSILNEDSKISAFYPVVFTTYEDGSHCSPRIENKRIDLCKNCGEKAIQIEAYVMDGSTTYKLINPEEESWMHAHRTIEFKPKKWEDLKDKIGLLKQSKEETECIMIQRIVAEDEVYNLHFCHCEGEQTIEITKENDDGIYEETFELTEEGYKKAIQKARNLFLGGKNGSQT